VGLTCFPAPCHSVCVMQKMRARRRHICSHQYSTTDGKGGSGGRVVLGSKIGGVEATLMNSEFLHQGPYIMLAKG
jgi:hypothetical protein